MTTHMRQAGRGGVLAAFAVLALTAAACSSPSGTSFAGAGSTGTAPGATATAALDFSGTTLDGARLDAATLAGTPVVLWFWAPWCTICRAEAPDVAKVATAYEGRVTMLGVPGRGEVDAMRAFVSETGTGAFTHVADIDGALWNRFGVVTQPAFVFVDRAGAAETVVGPLGADDLRAAVDKLT